MKITIEHNDRLTIINDDSAETTEQAVELARLALKGAGMPCVDEYIPDGDWLPMSEHFGILEDAKVNE